VREGKTYSNSLLDVPLAIAKARENGERYAQLTAENAALDALANQLYSSDN